MSDDIDDRKVSQAHAALRDAPPPALDAAVLAASRQALADDAAARATQARWRRWTPAFAVAATVTVGLALSLQLVTVPEPAQDAEDAVATAPREKPTLEQTRTETAELRKRDAVPDPAAPAALDLPKAALAVSGGSGAFVAQPGTAPVVDMKQERAAMRTEVAADAAQSLERAEVTGSRIKRTQQEGTDPEATAQVAAAAPAPTPASHVAVYPREALYTGPTEVRSVEKWRADIKALREAGKEDDATRETREMCRFYRELTECRR